MTLPPPLFRCLHTDLKWYRTYSTYRFPLKQSCSKGSPYIFYSNTREHKLLKCDHILPMFSFLIQLFSFLQMRFGTMHSPLSYLKFLRVYLRGCVSPESNWMALSHWHVYFCCLFNVFTQVWLSVGKGGSLIGLRYHYPTGSVSSVTEFFIRSICYAADSVAISNSLLKRMCQKTLSGYDDMYNLHPG